MATYTLAEIKTAAYNLEEQLDLTPSQHALWMGLAYCYEWHRRHPEDADDCKALADKYIKFFWGSDV